MPLYKLTYFNIRGRAEPIRLLFAQARVPYEDCRIQGGIQSPEWSKIKPTMPTGTLPVLEIDGKKLLPHTDTILRYLGREFNLSGSNSLEQAECDAVLETIVDVVNECFVFFKERDQAKKAEMKKPIFEDKVKPKLKHLENILIANGGENFVGKTVTVADIALFARFEFIQKLSDDPFKDFPKLKALKEKVGKEPRIAEWVAKRPETPS